MQQIIRLCLNCWYYISCYNGIIKTLLCLSLLHVINLSTFFFYHTTDFPYYQEIPCRLTFLPPDSFCFSSSASPVTAMHRWWGESPSYVLLHLKSVLMARKAYILFPNEANHSGGFAPHSLNPSPYATASGNRRMHITVVEAGLVTSDSRTKTQFWILWITRARIMLKWDFFFFLPVM